MFGGIRSEFQCSQKQGQNSTVWREKMGKKTDGYKNRARI